MTERLKRLTPEDLGPEQRALYDSIAAGPRSKGPQVFELASQDGSLNGPFGLMLHAPLLGQPLQELGAAVRYRTSFTDRAREIAILAVAVVTRSEFEWYAHERVGRAAGLTAPELADISNGNFDRQQNVDEVEAWVYRIARRLAGDGPIDSSLYGDAVRTLGELQFVELAVLVGYYRTLAQMMEVFNIGAPVVEQGGAR